MILESGKKEARRLKLPTRWYQVWCFLHQRNDTSIYWDTYWEMHRIKASSLVTLMNAAFLSWAVGQSQIEFPDKSFWSSKSVSKEQPCYQGSRTQQRHVASASRYPNNSACCSRGWTIRQVWFDNSLIGAHSRHIFLLEVKDIPLMKKSHPILQAGWLGGDPGPSQGLIYSFLIYKGCYLLYMRRKTAILPFLPLHTSQTLLPSLYSKSCNNQAPQQWCLSAVCSSREMWLYKLQSDACRCHTNNLASLSALSAATINTKKWS